jgi:hypothetical protein
MRESFEPQSNVTDDNFEHLLKQFEQRTSTDEGRQIDVSDEQPQNAESSMRDTFETDSNVTD